MNIEEDLSGFSRKIYLAVALVFLVFYLTIFYGVHYPFSITAVQIAIAILFVISIFWLPYNTLHLTVALIAPIFYFIQLYILSGIPVLEILLPFYKDTTLTDTHGVDINRAIDSARQGTIYVWVFIMSFYLCQEDEIRHLSMTSFAVLGGLVLVLALIAPHENNNVLWFYTIPTLINGWGSINASIEQSANFGFIWNFIIGDYEIFYPIKQVSTTIIGPVFNENQFAALLGVLLPITLSRLKYVSRNTFINYILILAASGVAIYLIAVPAHSRGGLLSLTATFIVLIMMKIYPRKRAYIVIACALIASIFSLYLAEYYGSISDTITSGRLLKWHDTLSIIKNAPLIGNAVGYIQSTGLINELHYPWITGDFKEWGIWYATHNVYLEWLAEHGIYGLACLSGTIIIFMRGSKQSKQATSTINQLPILLSLCFFVFYSMLDYSPSKQYTTLILTILLGCFSATRCQLEDIIVSSKWKIQTLPLKLLTILIILSVIVSATRFYRTEIVIRELNSVIAPVFKSIHYFDEPAKNALYEQKSEIQIRLSRAKVHFNEQRPDNQLAQSIARAYFLLSEGRDTEEINQAYNWLLIDKKISSNNIFNNMMLDQFKSIE